MGQTPPQFRRSQGLEAENRAACFETGRWSRLLWRAKHHRAVQGLPALEQLPTEWVHDLGQPLGLPERIRNLKSLYGMIDIQV